MFLGGWTTSRLAVGETKLEAVLYGVILWGVLFLGMIWLIAEGVRVGFGAMVSGAVADRHRGRPERRDGSPDALNKLVARAITPRWAATSSWPTWSRPGVDEAQARKIQASLKEKFDRSATSRAP